MLDMENSQRARNIQISLDGIKSRLEEAAETRSESAVCYGNN